MITQEYLKSRLNYNSETGEFNWIGKPNKRLPSGYKAGTLTRGYVMIHMNGKVYSAHRLAWLYVYGKLPSNSIDHINGIKDDNRITNLRDLTTAENAQNIFKAQKNSSHGLLGISLDKKQNLWRARITLNKRRIYIGKFKSKEDAHKAYIETKRTLHTYSSI
jgi:hypothetical protein